MAPAGRTPLLGFAQSLEPPPDDPQAALSAAVSRYPALSGLNLRAQWGAPQQDERQLEFYPPWERDNPNPGLPTVELYNRGLRGETLRDAIAADALHFLGAVDPRTGAAVNPAWRALRTQFQQGLTSEQQAMNRHAYERDRGGRPFEDFMEQSRLDAYLRALLFPQLNPDWAGMTWTPAQRDLGEQLRRLLER